MDLHFNWNPRAWPLLFRVRRDHWSRSSLHSVWLTCFENPSADRRGLKAHVTKDSTSSLSRRDPQSGFSRGNQGKKNATGNNNPSGKPTPPANNNAAGKNNTATNNAAGGAATNKDADPQTSLTLDPATIQTGSAQDGNPTDGQVASKTSTNNFVSWKTLISLSWPFSPSPFWIINVFEFTFTFTWLICWPFLTLLSRPWYRFDAVKLNFCVSPDALGAPLMNGTQTKSVQACNPIPMGMVSLVGCIYIYVMRMKISNRLQILPFAHFTTSLNL